jgi:hypothetical protein
MFDPFSYVDCLTQATQSTVRTTVGTYVGLARCIISPILRDLTFFERLKILDGEIDCALRRRLTIESQSSFVCVVLW